MDLLHTYQWIASLILKERLGMLENADAEKLQEWLSGHPHHRELYEHLKQKDLTLSLSSYREIDTEKGLAEYRKRYARRRRGYRWLAIAAVAVLFVGTGVCFWAMRDDCPDMEKGIVPGVSKAELVLGDGSVWTLENVIQEERVLSMHVAACHRGGRLSYRQLKNTSDWSGNTLEYNELRVPTGGEFQVILGDGTKVWLNSQSRLRYPVVFGDSVREVELAGEAYFDVASDKACPFRVRLRDDVRVEVLGTSFNVRNYPDEELVETVLERGSVRMVKGERSIRLEPGMRGVCTDRGEYLSADMVDTELYTSWKSGHFVFQNERLETILRKLSRWYEIRVVYRDEEVKDLMFSGNVKKYDTIETLLDAMEAAGGVRFDIRGHLVEVCAGNE